MRGHSLHTRAWVAVVAVLVLIAVHVAVFSLFSRAQLSLAILAALIGLVVLKCTWWMFRG